MITRKTDYAIRCVLHLAESRQDFVMMSEISKAKDVPVSFLAKILQELVKAGIVESTRGVKGGFRLTRKPSEINLLEVVEAIEGNVAMNICAVDKKRCSLSSTCTVHPVWDEVRMDVEERLRQWDFARLSGAEKDQD